MNKDTPYKTSPDPLWCEDCIHFCNSDMGGEGMCDLDNHDTWYAHPICEQAELKEHTTSIRKNLSLLCGGDPISVMVYFGLILLLFLFAGWLEGRCVYGL